MGVFRALDVALLDIRSHRRSGFVASVGRVVLVGDCTCDSVGSNSKIPCLMGLACNQEGWGGGRLSLDQHRVADNGIV